MSARQFLSSLLAAAALCACSHDSGNMDQQPLHKAGEIDTTFGEGGIRRISFANYASDVRIDGEGRILLASYSTDPALAYFTRVLPDGNLDQSLLKMVPTILTPFDARVFPFGATSFVGVYLMASAVPGTTLGAAQKFDAAGNADPSYGSNGSASFSTGSYADTVSQPDGSVVVFGVKRFSADPEVIRLDAQGHRDSAFEQNAQASLAVCSPSQGTSTYRAARKADGRIVVALRNGNGPWCVAQLNADGTPDGSFGTAGHSLFANPPAVGELVATVAILDLPGGATAVVLGSSFANPPAPPMTTVMWITPSGQLDQGRGGIRSYPSAQFPIQAPLAAAVQADGKVVIVGSVTATRLLLVRLDQQGNLDGGFGPSNNGAVALEAGGNRLSARKVTTSSAGTIYPAGSAAPVGTTSDAGYLAVSVMKLFTGEQ